MPIVQKSTYPGPPKRLFNGHLQTIAPSIFRKITGVDYVRERLTLSDGDFIDLDWINNASDQLVILTHGLEGDSHRHYIKGTAKLFSQNGWDVLAWNCRSCSGEMNRAFRMYSHGEIGDIGEVVAHALQTHNYKNVVMVGYSMGGNITLKYLGVNSINAPSVIRAAIAISAPTDLHSSAMLLDEGRNWFYRKRFMGKLIKKIRIKDAQHPGRIDLKNYAKVKVWKDFDEAFSAPINGYDNADDFYTKSSARNFLSGIVIPTLICNAQNDPILSPACAPLDIAQNSPLIYVETPATGGHVGFVVKNDEFTWAERRALAFANFALGSQS
jgi:uncharacterized protein